MEDLYALTILEVIKLKFGSNIGENAQSIVSFTNAKGNRIYVEKTRFNIKISAYKVSARCYYAEVNDWVNMITSIDELKNKLKL